MDDRVMCKTCLHRDVCKYRDDYVGVLETIDQASVYMYGDYVPLINIDWLEMQYPKCKRYLEAENGTAV